MGAKGTKAAAAPPPKVSRNPNMATNRNPNPNTNLNKENRTTGEARTGENKEPAYSRIMQYQQPETARGGGLEDVRGYRAVVSSKGRVRYVDSLDERFTRVPQADDDSHTSGHLLDDRKKQATSLYLRVQNVTTFTEEIARIDPPCTVDNQKVPGSIDVSPNLPPWFKGLVRPHHGLWPVAGVRLRYLLPLIRRDLIGADCQGTWNEGEPLRTPLVRAATRVAGRLRPGRSRRYPSGCGPFMETHQNHVVVVRKR